MLVGLLRHGETQGGPRFRGHTDDPLTATGLAQMQAAVSNSQTWQQVITSPLQRCAAFAEAFAQQHSQPLTMDERLKELHFGEWEGRTAAELMAETPDALTQFWNAPDQHPPPGGEPLPHFQHRVLAAWHDIIDNHRGQHVLIVTHGGVIRVLLCHVLQRPTSHLLDMEVKHGALYRLRVTNRTTHTAKVEVIENS